MKKITNKIFYLYYEMALFFKGNDPIYSAKLYYTVIINYILIFPILSLLFLKISNDFKGGVIALFLGLISYYLIFKYHTKKIFTKERVNIIIKSRIKNIYLRYLMILITIIFGLIIYSSSFFTLVIISKMLE